MNEEQDDITEEEMYEFLQKECEDLIDQYEKIRQENEQEFKLSENHLNRYTEQQNEDENEFGSNPEFNIPENLDSKEDIEKYKDKLLEEKRALESQFIDVNIDIQRKKRQIEDFHSELENTKKGIQLMESKIQEKDKAIKILEEHIEKFKQF
ncbi:hypothetical protein TTHERM_00497840 (macronuclear) [Tetrahymena thermophila SB210]|uniref:Uncharacterized protein n=1 Tax=Tetrahymena thermophila (strain SB210) TaxID=312017 RepID=I7LY55_TETTS|nr:hypothetical protein TTHERM_00497840 [Tetrahymena thermophila SB210]EAS07730.1 hypothetical protein TTHERM_00497840 [Tetrahymena thermophila SB210]|eukprot:XP_001027972.1 hypothetical protein TTHERM_00497840 [Tetrahymena thermophila SB210]